MLIGDWHRFGYAVANFGTPISMQEYSKAKNINFLSLDKNARIEQVKLLTKDLMKEVGNLIPVSPVSLISQIFAENPEKVLSNLELKARAQSLIEEFENKGAYVYIPRRDRDYAIQVGLRMLVLRHIVQERDGLYFAPPEEGRILRYYANSISHHIPIQKKAL
jgi:glycerol-3-phosphate O-acyltransferase